MSSESLLKYLTDRKKINETSRAVLAQKYRQNQQLLYPNAETLETLTGAEIDEINYYMPEILKPVVSVVQQTMTLENDYDTILKIALDNFKQIVSPNEAQTIIDLFDDGQGISVQQLKLINSNFNNIKNEVSKLQFSSLADLVDYIITYIEAKNKVKPSVSFSDRLKVNNALNNKFNEDLYDLEETRLKNLPATSNISSIDLQDMNLTQTERIENLKNEIETTIKNSVSVNQRTANTLFKKIKEFAAASVANEPADIQKAEEINFIMFALNSAQNLNPRVTTPLPSRQSSAFYKQHLINLVNHLDTDYKPRFMGNGLKNKKPKRRGLKFVGYGKAIPKIEDVDKVNHFVKGHLYIDMNKMNDNILAIKYVKTGNKKNEVQITDNTKAVLIQLINNKFNASSYEKLNENEKKIISFVNHIFKLVSKDILSNEPIEELYNKYQILKGQIEAGNNNPLILKNLKQILFELHKFKKINSAQLRNIIFELSNID
jgi:hypothetical protein